MTAELAYFGASVVEVLKRKFDIKGKECVGVQIRHGTEVKTVPVSMLQPYTPPVAPTHPEVPAPPTIKESSIFVDRVQEPHELTSIPTIGKVAARSILDRRNALPEQKFGSFEKFKEVCADIPRLDWDIIATIARF